MSERREHTGNLMAISHLRWSRLKQICGAATHLLNPPPVSGSGGGCRVGHELADMHLI